MYYRQYGHALKDIDLYLMKVVTHQVSEIMGIGGDKLVFVVITDIGRDKLVYVGIMDIGRDKLVFVGITDALSDGIWD